MLDLAARWASLFPLLGDGFQLGEAQLGVGRTPSAGRAARRPRSGPHVTDSSGGSRGGCLVVSFAAVESGVREWGVVDEVERELEDLNYGL